MPVLSPKRQVTLPKELCDRLQVSPGDDLDFVEHDGRITIIKKRKGASAGVLKHLKSDSRLSDDDSRQSTLDKKHGPIKSRRSAA